jgi:hypothetical protein
MASQLGTVIDRGACFVRLPPSVTPTQDGLRWIDHHGTHRPLRRGLGRAAICVLGLMASYGVALAASPSTPMAEDAAAKLGALAPMLLDGAGHVAGITLSFLNLAALKNFNMKTAASHIVTATTAGYANPGDGGASIYDWDADATRAPDNIFLLKASGTPTGRWILRLPAGSIHPEQAGAKCDGVTDDATALNALTKAINNAPESVNNGLRIDLNPNRFCLFEHASWRTPNGATVAGTINPINDAVETFDPFTSGFLHPASVRLEVGRGGRLKDMTVLRQGMKKNPRTLQAVMTEVMNWYGENGEIADVTPEHGSAGAGCAVGDKLELAGGAGNDAWVVVTEVNPDGAVSRVRLLDPGAYMAFPKSPLQIAGPPASPNTPYRCSTLPRLMFSHSTPRSVGVELRTMTALENVFVAGFNLGIASLGGGTRMDHVAFDDANGIDISRNGENGVYRDITGGELWSTSATHHGVGSFGVVKLIRVADGGTQNRIGDVLTVLAGVCAMPPQVTVDQTLDGAITAAHLSTYGDCTPVLPKQNPAKLSNLHGGIGGAVNLLWADFDYRPGIAIYVHDQCDGCMFSDIGVHGWPIGFDLSNVWAVTATSLTLEPANFSTGPAPPPLSMFGLRTRNFVQGMFFGIHAGGYSVGAELLQTGCPHEEIPFRGCGPSVSENDLNGSISISGATFGFPNKGASYAIDIGPYSRGIISDVQINTAGLPTAVNIQGHVYGWVLRDIMPFGADETHWLTIDPTSRARVFANAIPSMEGPTAPLVVMGGLPTSSAGLPSGSLWNNKGVVNIVP